MYTLSYEKISHPEVLSMDYLLDLLIPFRKWTIIMIIVIHDKIIDMDISELLPNLNIHKFKCTYKKTGFILIYWLII